MRKPFRLLLSPLVLVIYFIILFFSYGSISLVIGVFTLGKNLFIEDNNFDWSHHILRTTLLFWIPVYASFLFVKNGLVGCEY